MLKSMIKTELIEHDQKYNNDNKVKIETNNEYIM